MSGDRQGSSLAAARALLAAVFARDASGRSWLPSLLAATPRGPHRLGALIDDPGSLLMSLSAQTVSGRLGCFEYPAAPPRELLEWFIDHPDRLVWPNGVELTPEATRLRRALLNDEPVGSQARAQARARELLETWSPLSPDWWRFEDMIKLDCVLMTDRLIVTVHAQATRPSTDWYPARSRLVRTLEAARQLAHGRRWFSLAISEESAPHAEPDRVGRSLAVAAPHLNPASRAELAEAYLGNVTLADACRAVDVPLAALTTTSKRR